jgi:hypothetical protein
MIPTQARQPFHRDGWAYEEKIDGWRMLAYKNGRTVRLESRNGVDHTRRFPDLAAAVAALPGRPRHADILDWPGGGEKHSRLMVATEIANGMTLEFDPRGTA